MKKAATAAQVTIEIPGYNERDVEFLQEIRQAHNHDKLSDIGADIERAFRSRVEYEFLDQEVTSKTRAVITEFCSYLLSIAKFYGYNLSIGGLTTVAHGDMFSVRTLPSNKISTLVESVFTYFDNEGNYKLTANGFMRRDWVTAPDDPVNRRAQILRDNNDTMPGLGGNNSIDHAKCYIHIEITGQFPLLVLPIE